MFKWLVRYLDVSTFPEYKKMEYKRWKFRKVINTGSYRNMYVFNETRKLENGRKFPSIRRKITTKATVAVGNNQPLSNLGLISL
jgi:hypothetical protein